MKINFYGIRKRPVVDFIESQIPKDQAKILACLKSVEELGFDCPRVEFRQITSKLWEIKIATASAGYRIFYVTLKRDILVLLHAYKKQSQKAPKKEIAIAEKRLMEVLNNESFYFK